MNVSNVVSGVGAGSRGSRIETISKFVLIVVCLAPTLLTPALKFQIIICHLPIGLLDIATCLLLGYIAFEREKSSVIRLVVYCVVGAAITCSLFVVWVFFSLSPMILLFFACCFLGMIWLSNHIKGRLKWALSLLVASGACVKIIVCSTGMTIGTEDPLYGTSNLGLNLPYVTEQIDKPNRRYRIIYDHDGSIMTGIKRKSYSELYTHGFSKKPIRTEQSFIRFVNINKNHIAISDRIRGLSLLNRDDFTQPQVIYDSVHLPYWFSGIVHRKSTNEIIGLRTDGRLFFFDDSTLELKKETWLPIDAAGGGLRDDYYNDAKLLLDQFLVVNEEFPPHLVLIDLESNQLIRRVAIDGPPGNLTTIGSGNSFFVIEFPVGKLYEYDSKSLDLIGTNAVGFGFRYHTVLPDQRHIAAGNYITGEVRVLDLESGEKTGPFHTGLNLQWLSVSPDGKFLDASHFQGITRIDIDNLLSTPKKSSPPTLFPFWILRPKVIQGILLNSMEKFDVVALNWALFFLALSLFRRTQLNFASCREADGKK